MKRLTRNARGGFARRAELGMENSAISPMACIARIRPASRAPKSKGEAWPEAGLEPKPHDNRRHLGEREEAGG